MEENYVPGLLLGHVYLILSGGRPYSFQPNQALIIAFEEAIACELFRVDALKINGPQQTARGVMIDVSLYK